MSSSELGGASTSPAEAAARGRVQARLVAAIAEYVEQFQRDERAPTLSELHGLTPAQIASVCGQMLRATDMTAFDIADRSATDHQWEELVYVVS